MISLRRGILALLLAGIAPAAFGADSVNFSIITVKDPGAEGPEVTRPVITLGKRTIAFRKPQNCQVSSAPDALSIFLNQPGQSGQITVRNSTFTPAKEFVALVDEYKNAAAATIPEKAENVKYLSGKFDLLKINDWKSLTFEWEYTDFARPTRRQVTYVNLDEETQIVVTVVSDVNSWEASSGLAGRFMRSWYWLEDPKVVPVSAPKAPAKEAPAPAALPQAPAAPAPKEG